MLPPDERQTPPCVRDAVPDFSSDTSPCRNRLGLTVYFALRAGKLTCRAERDPDQGDVPDGRARNRSARSTASVAKRLSGSTS